MHNKYQIHVFTAQRQISDIVYIDLTNPYQILFDKNHFLFQTLFSIYRLCFVLSGSAFIYKRY